MSENGIVDRVVGRFASGYVIPTGGPASPTRMRAPQICRSSSISKTAGGWGRFSEYLCDILETFAFRFRGRRVEEMIRMIKADREVVGMMRKERMTDQDLRELLADAKVLYQASSRMAAGVDVGRVLGRMYKKVPSLSNKSFLVFEYLGVADPRRLRRQIERTLFDELIEFRSVDVRMDGVKEHGLASDMWVTIEAPKGREFTSGTVTAAFDEMPGFRGAFQEFMKHCKAVSDRYMEDQFPTLDKPTFSAMEGGRYIRVVKGSGGSRQAHLFVDKTNGDILMAGGWAAPAKHARGNIFNQSTWATAVGPYGARYLRGGGVMDRMAERVARDFAAYGGRISAVVAHHHWDGGHCYVDTPFVSNLSAVFPGSRLEHMGFGEFYLTTKEGRIDFDRMRGKDFPGQSGRSHRLEDEVGGRIVEEAVKRMEARGLSVDSGM